MGVKINSFAIFTECAPKADQYLQSTNN